MFWKKNTKTRFYKGQSATSCYNNVLEQNDARKNLAEETCIDEMPTINTGL